MNFMKKLFALFTLLWAAATVSMAGVLVTEYMSVTKGSQVKSSVEADTYYIISGIDQASRECYLYDNGRQVKGSTVFPTANESTASHLWTLKSNSGNWVIVNVGTKKVMNLGGSNGSSITMSDTQQANAIHFDSNGYMTILNSNGQAIDMTANGANPTTWAGTTTPTGSRRLKMYAVENIQTLQSKSLSLIPAPKSAVVGDGEFVLQNGFTIAVEPFSDAEEQNMILADVARFITTMNNATGLDCNAAAGVADITISENSNVAPEGYILDITADGVKVEASAADGVYYALQSIMRLLPPNVILGKPGEGNVAYTLPVARVEDEPRFGYRGFMLDVSRHFFTIEQVKKMIDLMAIYKMNVFHWHLTDDQGWRAEIKQYPLLTSKGAERRSSYDTPITKVEENGQVYWTGEGAQTNRKYGPFYYTQEEMKDVVRYAAERHIDVLPEVDMPGHFVAALAAYPQFSCHPSYAPEVWINGGISADVLNVANPEAVEFANNIITELCTIFPYPYFHIGGDECPTSQWETNALCQEKLAQLGKTSYRALQTEFIREINEHLNSLGKKMFCWNESITESGADLDLMKASGATIMCWNPCQSGAAKAASLGLNAIITEWGSGCYYINRRQSSDYGEPTAAGSGADNVAATYNYVPVPASVSAEHAKHYIGVQGTFWAEHVSSNEYLEYLALPRFMCVAEAGWTPQELKSWPSFVRRMTLDTKMLDLGGYIYARHWMDDYVPRQAPASVIADGSVVTFTNQSPDRGQCLADDNGTLNGQGSACTGWTLEAAPTAGMFYIRSNVSGLYLYASNGNSGTMVSLSTSKTMWAFDTTTMPGYVAMCYNSTSGYAINNNVSNTTKTRLFAHGTSNGASFWAMEAAENNELQEGETGLLEYNFYYRGISVGRKEFRLQAGSAYPSFEEHLPAGYVAAGATLPDGTVHLVAETIEIPVARVPKAGSYYRFYNPAMNRYLSADETSYYTYGVEEPTPNTIFYYYNVGDGEQQMQMMAYDRGLYLSGAALADAGIMGSGASIQPSLSAAVDMYNIVSDGYVKMSQDADASNTLGDASADSEQSAYDFGYRQVNSLPVSIGADGWATFAAPVPVTVPQGCVAYVASAIDDAADVLYVDSITPGTAIAANSGILLRGTPSSVVELVISESGYKYNANLLLPSVAANVLDANAYTLVCDGDAVSFKRVDGAGAAVPAHSCYLLGNDAYADTLTIVFPGNETGIDDIVVEHSNAATIYNVHGQALRAPQRGINIINGKKVVVK